MIYRQKKTDHAFFLGCGRYPDCDYAQEIPESLTLQLLGVKPLPGFLDV